MPTLKSTFRNSYIPIRDVTIGFLGKMALGFEKPGLKPIVSFTDLHKNIVLYKGNNFVHNAL